MSKESFDELEMVTVALLASLALVPGTALAAVVAVAVATVVIVRVRKK